MALNIAISQEADAVLVKVAGEVDVSNASELRGAIDAKLPETTGELVVDLADVPYIDSTGIGVLVGAGAGRHAGGGPSAEKRCPRPRHARRGEGPQHPRGVGPRLGAPAQSKGPSGPKPYVRRRIYQCLESERQSLRSS